MASTARREGGGGGVKMLDESDVEGLNRMRAEHESHAAGVSSIEARKIERRTLPQVKVVCKNRPNISLWIRAAAAQSMLDVIRKTVLT